jgi:hypothetical protein
MPGSLGRKMGDRCWGQHRLQAREGAITRHERCMMHGSLFGMMGTCIWAEDAEFG